MLKRQFGNSACFVRECSAYVDFAGLQLGFFKFVDVRIKKSDLELEAQQLELKRLETEEAYGEQQQRISELTTQLQEISIDETRLKQQEFEEAAELDIQIQET